MGDNIPNEVWCTVFSYLDRKSLKCATLTCKLWFELIRSDVKLSGHIVLNNFGLDYLQTKIENLRWKWERWPALKTIELENGNEPESKEEALDMVKKIKFEFCPTLENVIFNVDLELANFYKIQNYCRVEKLLFNPKIDLETFGIEHIFQLHLHLEKDWDTLDIIGKNAKNLVDLTISIDCSTNADLQKLENSCNILFKRLKNSLKCLTLSNRNEVYGSTVLKALSKHCPNLSN